MDMPTCFDIRALVLAVVSAGAAATTVLGQPLQYPQTRQVEHQDTYHGVAVHDPYRWLEDMTAPETRSWVDAQNRLTQKYLMELPFRSDIQARVRAINGYTRHSGVRGASSAFRKGPFLFFKKQEPGQAQPLVYFQRALDAEPEVLLDPNQWSADGTALLGLFSPSPDGKFVTYGISQGGSDWQEYRVIEVATRRALPDRLRWIKGNYAHWHGNGFYYSRYPAPPAGQERTAVNEHHAAYFHRLGDEQRDDRLVHADPAHPRDGHFVELRSAPHRAVLISRTPGRDFAISSRDLSMPGEWTPVLSNTGSEFGVIDIIGDALYVKTNYKAPMGRVVRIDVRKPAEEHWVTVVPEQPELMQDVSSGGGKLFVRLLKDVVTRVHVYNRDGTFDHEVLLPGPGLAAGFGSEDADQTVFYTFTSLTVPETIYRYDLTTRTSTVFRAPRLSEYSPEAFETTQVFYSGKDGTKVPMFLMHRKGLKLDGTNPTLLYAYGAFGATTWPWFSASRLALIEQGFVYASANIRGGGEYGRPWHDAGKGKNRQTTFDDFIAAAEWLVSNKYTSPARLAAYGVSSGGTLVGTVINQRPDLFRAAVAEAGVMDMLRFQAFTGGFHWAVETGSSDKPDEFAFLRGYSPLHNIRLGARYPATLIMAADFDDRVVPAHSYKYAATLQAQAARQRPVLLRVDTGSGHSLSSLDRQLDTFADMSVFLMRELGVAPAPARPAAQGRPDYP
jgi:prolyl oligopeptidase